MQYILDVVYFQKNTGRAPKNRPSSSHSGVFTSNCCCSPVRPPHNPRLFNEAFLNAIMGWTLGTGFYVRGAYFAAVASTCGFEPGECYIAVFEPQGLLNHECEWHLVDICHPEVKVMHGTGLHYRELERMQPGGMPLALFEKHTKICWEDQGGQGRPSRSSSPHQKSK